MPDAMAWLAEHDRPFREVVSALAGKPLSPTTTWKWRTLKRVPDTAALALIELLRRNPSLMEQVR